MSERLPVVIVDDDHEQLDSNREVLEMHDWSVATYDDIDVAARELVERTDPFVLLLDHDFARHDGRTGKDLSTLLRLAHPWGAALPIQYWSGRIDGNGFLDLQRELQLAAPTSYVYKGSDISVVDVVRMAEDSFEQFKTMIEQQALRRALLNADEDLAFDSDDLLEEER